MSENSDVQSNEFEFKAQVQQVLSLVINSLYTNTEVFLRELVSNASDALDKGRFLQLSETDKVREQEGEPAIEITLDSEKGTLTLSDNGVGMTRDEVIEHLGTIAHSGTGEFVKKFGELTKKGSKDEALDLIGQFGVGFYSSFMVASRVDVHTLSMREGSESVLWRSSGEGSFTVLPGVRETPGTSIVLHLKEDASEFGEAWRVQGIIKKYSDFVMFPITVDGERANSSLAPWRMSASKVTEEQHRDFFSHLSQGQQGDEPLATIHYAVDAPVQFSALLYVPTKAAPGMFNPSHERIGLRLYAKRVLIMENCESLIPSYLRFLRGVVDSEDLNLNVSRETLQENRTVRQIESQLTKKTLKTLANMADEDADRYKTFWGEFGQVLKEGLSVDFKNRDALADLCRFESLNHGEGELVSLARYVEEKGKDAEDKDAEDKDAEDKKKPTIYYLTGPTREAVVRSPHLEMFRKKGLDVLLMVDPIDEWVVKALPEYKAHTFTSAAHGELKLDEKDQPEKEESVQKELDGAVVAIKKALGDRVDEVRLSGRLTETASCLVAKAGDPGANLERLMRMVDSVTEEKKRVLEVNPDHVVVRNLAKAVARDQGAEKINLWAELLYDQALLSEGVIEDPAQLVSRIQALLIESSSAAVKD